MCYNVSYLEKRAERVAKHYGAHFKPEDRSLELFHVSGFAHPRLNVITEEAQQLIQQYTWGLIPKWCKDEQQAKEISVQTLNAKAETVFEKNSFKHSILTKRCIVIVSGFFEWQTFAKNKYPYYITLKEQPFFSLGGLYEHWTDKQTGVLHHTFSIITVEANPLMAKIHNSKKRMPFIIPQEHEKDWLKNDLSESEIRQLMQPLNDSKMEAFTISKKITDRNHDNNTADVLKPFEYPELAFLE